MGEVPGPGPEEVTKEAVAGEYPPPIGLADLNRGDLEGIIYPYLRKIGLQNMPGDTGARRIISWLENARRGVTTLDYYRERVETLLQLERDFVGKRVEDPAKGIGGTIKNITTETIKGRDPKGIVNLAVFVEWENGSFSYYRCTGPQRENVELMVRRGKSIASKDSEQK